MAGHDQLEEAGQQLLAGQPVVRTGRDQEADQVVAGVEGLGVDQVAEVADDPVRCGHGLRWGVSGPRLQQGPEVVVEHGPLGLGDPEQLSDHLERQGVGVPGDEVDDRAGALRREAVEQLVRDGLDGRGEHGDPRGAEGAGDEPAEPGVVGRVDVEHVASERRPGQPLVDHLGVVVEGGDHVLGDPRVPEHLAGGVVSQDQPGIVAVGEAAGADRALLAGPGEVPEGVVADLRAPSAPGGEVSHRRSPVGTPSTARTGW